MKIRTLIVDQECAARRRLSLLLGLEDDFELAGECADGKAAADTIAQVRPDVMFLNPSVAGDELETWLRTTPSRIPACVFVSNDSQFSVPQLGMQSVDCLLQPLRLEPWVRLLARVRGWMGGASESLGTGREWSADAERLIVRSSRRLTFIRLRDLELVEAALNYVELKVGNDVHRVRGAIGALQEQLDPRHFLRIHRGFIVNIDQLRAISHVGSGEYMVRLDCGRELPIGPTYLPKIEAMLEQSNLPRLGW